MAVSITAVRDALAAQIQTRTTGLRTYARLSGQMQTPAAVVLPGVPYVDRDQTMQRGHARMSLDVAIVVRTSNLDEAQQQLDGLIDTVTDAVLFDKTLSGAVSDLHVPTVTAPEDGELSGVQVLTSVLEVRLIVRDD